MNDFDHVFLLDETWIEFSGNYLVIEREDNDE